MKMSDLTDTDILKDPSLTKDERTEYGIKRRRLQSILTTCGFGVIIFSVWSIIRVLLHGAFTLGLYVSSPEDTVPVAGSEADVLLEEELAALDTNVFVILFFVLIGILILEVVLRIFVGFSARAEGRGKKKTIAYIIIAGILIPYQLLGVIYNFSSIDYMSGLFLDTIITMILDISSLISLIELFVAAIMLRRLKKREIKDYNL